MLGFRRVRCDQEICAGVVQVSAASAIRRGSDAAACVHVQTRCLLLVIIIIIIIVIITIIIIIIIIIIILIILLILILVIIIITRC